MLQLSCLILQILVRCDLLRLQMLHHVVELFARNLLELLLAPLHLAIHL